MDTIFREHFTIFGEQDFKPNVFSCDGLLCRIVDTIRHPMSNNPTYSEDCGRGLQNRQRRSGRGKQTENYNCARTRTLVNNMGGVGEWSVVTRDPAPPVTQECVHTVHSAHVVASVQCAVHCTLYCTARCRRTRERSGES